MGVADTLLTDGSRESFTVPVVGNTGSVTFNLYGHVKSICIIAPSDIAAYEYNVVDEDGFGRTGKIGLTGTNTIDGDTIIYGGCIFTILNATDGDYLVRLYCTPN